MNKDLLLISSTRFRGGAPLAHASEQVTALLEGVSTVLFVPYARPGGRTHAAYTEVTRKAFLPFNKAVKGVNEFDDPRAAVAEAEAVFIGGGNTFLLLHDLYANDLLEVLRDRVNGGMPYMGTSAGSNVAGLSICTTNDMPIIYPPSFDALQFIPFNINPHFIPGKTLKDHMGETREDRIHEFHFVNSQPVVGIREDSMLRLVGGHLELIGQSPAVLFAQGVADREIDPGTGLDFLLG